MTSTFSKRKLTFNERLYQVGADLVPPFAIQLILEGNGDIAVDRLRKQLKELAQHIPALGLRIKKARWYRETKGPDFIVHEKGLPQDWNSAIFRSPLDARSGRASEFHLFQGEKTSLVFRTLHSTTDARGACFILRQLCSLMRGESIEKHTDYPSDMTVGGQISKKQVHKRERYAFNWPGYALADQQTNEYKTEVISFPFRLESAVARVANCLSLQYGEDCRFLIPVDIRRHPSVRDTAANLSLPIYLHVSPQQSWQEIQAGLLKDLGQDKELANEPLQKFALLLPERLLSGLLKWSIRKSQKTNRFPMSGIISDIGYVDLRAYSFAGFSANQLISLPVYVPLAPVCVNVLSHSSQTHISLCLPAQLDTRKIAHDLAEFLEQFRPRNEGKHTQAVADKKVAHFRELWADILNRPLEAIDPEKGFYSLGGDSISFLGMISEVSGETLPSSRSAFMSTAMNTGGNISIYTLGELMDRFSAPSKKMEK